MKKAIPTPVWIRVPGREEREARRALELRGAKLVREAEIVNGASALRHFFPQTFADAVPGGGEQVARMYAATVIEAIKGRMS